MDGWLRQCPLLCKGVSGTQLDIVHVNIYMSMMYFTPVTSVHSVQTGFHRSLGTSFQKL